MLHERRFIKVYNQTLRRLLTGLREFRIGYGFRRVAKGEGAPAAVAFRHHRFHFGFRPLADLHGIHPIQKDSHVLVGVACKVVGELLLDHDNLNARVFQQVFRDMEYVAARKPRHVGNDNGVNRSRFRSLEQTFPIGAFQVRTALSLIRKLARRNAAEQRNVIGIDLPLRVDGGEVAVLLVIR